MVKSVFPIVLVKGCLLNAPQKMREAHSLIGLLPSSPVHVFQHLQVLCYLCKYTTSMLMLFAFISTNHSIYHL